MHNEQVVKEWLAKADEDCGFAEASLQHDDFYAQICFHFQQAAEKYLKVFIIANELEFRRVHNLLELLATCKKKANDIEKIMEACQYLNAFYIDTRYPVHWPAHYDKATALRARDAVDIIRRWLGDHLGF